MTTPWRARARHSWREWGKPLLLLILGVGSFRSAVADWNDVPSGSMRPSILEGDRIFVNKLAYDLRLPFSHIVVATLGEPQCGDIVILASPENGQRLVKRVIGLPGDRIEMERGQLLVNGAPGHYEAIPESLETGERLSLREELAGRAYPIQWRPGGAGRRDFGVLVVPPGHYFVLGDNRDLSRDSRWFGFVPRRAVYGRAVAVVASVDPTRSYLPRWERFFDPLP